MSDFVPVPRPASRHCGRGGGRGRHRRGGRQSGHRGGRGRGRGFRGWGPPQRSSDNLGRGSQMDALPEVLGTPTPSDNSLCIAVQGCCHGELDAIYRQIRAHEEKSGRKVDLLLCCGDFQSLRNTADYQSLAVPPKYRRLGSFCKYYSGECLAPVLTVFIGGNHEASQPLHELYYGGWVAPNIYYLGAAGVVDVRGVRIGGIGGIYKSHDYLQGRFERPPYDRSTIRSVYHVRNVDIFRLKCLSPERSRLGMMLSHDWPQGVEQNGDTGKLLRQKPFFRDEVQRNDLGSPPNRELLDLLQPQWWFSAHLHVKFRATVRHTMADLDSRSSKSIAPARLIPSQVDSVHPPARSKDDTDTKDTKDDSTQNSSTDFVSLESSDPCAGPDLTEQMTQFMALDKCLPRRQHLSILHVPCEDMNGPAALRYDLEWLAILRKTHHLTEASRRRVYLPPGLLQVTDGEMEAIRARLSNREIDGADRDDPLIIPSNFCITVPPHDDPRWRGDPSPLNMMGNPQTDEIMAVLGIEHVITVPYLNTSAPAVDKPHIDRACVQEDENEIDLDEEEDEALGVAADRISGEIGTGPKAVDCNEGYGNVMSEDMDGGPSKMPSTC